MTINWRVLIFPAVMLILSLVAWYYHGEYQAEKKRADDAEQSASAAEAITANVIQAVNIINSISEANQHAKQQIALDSQNAQKDIRVAVAGDSCADRPVPAAAVKRLHDYADSLRKGSGGSTAGKPDG